MLTVFQYGDIRRAHRYGMSIREIARTFHHSMMNDNYNARPTTTRFPDPI